MARYEIYGPHSGDGYLLDVQSNLLGVLNTRVVVPLLPQPAAPKPAQRLNPVFRIDGREYVLTTQFIAAIPASELGESRGSLESEHDRIVAALDMLFQGF